MQTPSTLKIYINYTKRDILIIFGPWHPKKFLIQVIKAYREYESINKKYETYYTDKYLKD